MSSTTSYRLSGIALLIGGMLGIIYYVSQVFISVPSERDPSLRLRVTLGCGSV